MKKNISIIGSGSWGTALAIHPAKKGHNVKVWSFHNFERLITCQVNYQNIYSACFLDNNIQIFILVSSFHDYGVLGTPKKISVLI